MGDRPPGTGMLVSRLALERWRQSWRSHFLAGCSARILRRHPPELKVRVVDVIDLMTLQPASKHPHGLSDQGFDALFTTDKPIIFA
jgi:hypothetical protein